jgi:hypothetical protein
MKPSMKLQDDLASYPQVKLFIYHLLSVAQAGGMTKPRAKKLYDEIHEHFSNIQGDVFWSFRDGLIHVLTMHDEDFDLLDEKDTLPYHWNMN